jgi:serine/threonine-protein kinase
MPSTEGFPQARTAAMRALQLDDRLAEAYIALGFIRSSYDWEWAAAERDLQTAINISPRNADAHRAYAHLLSNQARHAEAIVEGERARELDPRSLLTNVLAAQFSFYAGRLDDAEEGYRKTLEIEPGYWPAHLGLGRVYTFRGMFPEAIGAFRKAISLSSGAVEPVTQLGYALARSGKRAEARALLRELASVSADEYVPAYSYAMILNGLEDKAAALRQLERSVNEREVQATFIKIDTRWDSVRPDPRFIALLKLMNLE